MNNKNIKHKEALKRKNQAKDLFESIGLNLDDSLMSVGLVLDHIGLSHLNYFAITSINDLYKDYYGIDINIFYQETNLPIIDPFCPVLEKKFLTSCRYPLIATNTSTLLDAINSKSELIFYYIFDFKDFTESYNDSMTQLLNNNRIKIITRCEEYKNIIEKIINKKIIEDIILDFDIKKFIKLIIKEIKNEKK